MAVGVGASAVAASAIAVTDVSDFSFDSFDGQYFLDVDSDGRATTRVVETLVARFPDFDQNRGIIRAIPLTDGEVRLELSMISVTDENGDPVYFERNDYNGFAEFALGTDEFVQGRTTYVLEYTLANTIRHFADSGGDEFYWDINGNGWAQSFDEVSAHVTLSDQLAKSLTGQSACYLGYYGETGECELSRNDSGTQFDVTVAPVGPYNTLTVSIGFDGGTVVQPALPRDSWIVQLVPKVIAGLAGLLVAISFVIRNFFWRDARGRGTIIAQFEPPEGSSIMLDANIISRPSPALPAQLVDFAVRGMVNVIDSKAEGSSGRESKRFSIEFVTDHGASPQEHAILVILFGGELKPGERVNPGSLSASIGAALYALPSSAAAWAISQGFRAQPTSAIPKIFRRIAFGLVVAFVPVWAWAAYFDVLEGNVLLPVFLTVGLAIAVPFIIVRPYRLTRKGAEAKEYLLGLREYLTIAEEDRLRVLQSPEGALRVSVTDHEQIVKLNERLLPYAVLWGVEEQWAQKLRAEYAGQSPTWFSGDFDSSVLRSFSVASTSSVRPIVTSSSGGSSWSSSGSSSFSSGSSGGGFSGGGGGGGGGGGR